MLQILQTPMVVWMKICNHDTCADVNYNNLNVVLLLLALDLLVKVQKSRPCDIGGGD